MFSGVIGRCKWHEIDLGTILKWKERQTLNQVLLKIMGSIALVPVEFKATYHFPKWLWPQYLYNKV